MKLIVNVSPLKHPMTGVGRYVMNLLQAINRHPQVEDLVGITLTGFIQRDAMESLIQQLNSPLSNRPGIKGRILALAGQFRLARQLQHYWLLAYVYLNRHRYQDHIYWETSGKLLPLNGPVVSTIFDLSHLAFPQFHPTFRVRELTHRIPDYLNRSNLILTISQFTKREIHQHFTPSAPVHIVYPAVSMEYFHQSKADIDRVRKQLNLPDGFVLAVSTLEPRKNLAGLIKAYSTLSADLQQRFPLILAGASGWLSAELDNIIRGMQHRGVLRHLGYVSQKDLPAVVAAASLNVYVSFYEGYGMPIAESMASGTPMLCSNSSSMPEVANNACFLTDPHDPEAVALQLEQLLQNSELRRSKVQLARQLASSYTWDNSAQQWLKALQSISQ